MTLDEFKKICTDHMFWCYGTSEIFQQRARKLKIRREWITYLGIIGPVIIGGVASAFGKNWALADVEVLPILIFIAGAVSVGQLVLSVWAVVARWDESYASAQESIRANTALYNSFQSLRDAPPDNFKANLHDLREQNSRQEVFDNAQSIKEGEKRYAYHASMKYLNLPCRTCKKIPAGKSSNCTGCGDW